MAAADCIGERVQGIADEAKDVLDPDLCERLEQDVGDRSRHGRLLSLVCPRTTGLRHSRQRHSDTFDLAVEKRANSASSGRPSVAGKEDGRSWAMTAP
jgi:hypothetical protein